MSSNYSDETCNKIKDFIDWVEKNIEQELAQSESISNIESMERTDIEQSTQLMSNDSFKSDGNNDGGGDESDIEKRFGTHNIFQTSSQARFRFQKPEDVTKKNEVFKRLTKRSKKMAQIPIHHTHKQITSYASLFEVNENKHVSQLWFMNDKEEDSDDGDDGESDELENEDEISEADSASEANEDTSNEENDVDSVSDEFYESEEVDDGDDDDGDNE